ncbi:hypothetical protein [Pseudomonas chlororaphis]|uniref:hypothetical protein n=1 Tax=Pseudomonas chlororaphis TaxID=587753 RepID=UPI000F5846AF|nr:hypothetical protein [Pseudomonas chlororaphis]AZC94885.1 hypothetical protein C4K28_2157 [Pseudomonas chlororaphis subsp. piscium]QTT81728.1 hypothetical protein HUT29_10640 [Pseudomonas chlororaphis]
MGQAKSRGTKEERVQEALDRRKEVERDIAERRRTIGQKIAEFNKLYQTKVCLAPHENHEGPIVSAHTLSLEAFLRPISREGRVYAIRKNLSNDPMQFPLSLELQGLRDVSVFNGFCRTHDRDLFACIETRPFEFSPEQLFMLAYRAVVRESYLKRKQHESFPSLEQIASIHGIKEKIQFTERVEQYLSAVLDGASEIETLKGKLDELLMAKDWGRLVSRALIFPEPPSVVASFAVQPSTDLNGNQLQDLSDRNIELSHVMVSIIPLKAGSAAIFSWLDTANSAPLRFFDSLAQSGAPTKAVIHAALDLSENIALSPEWYDSLAPVTQKYVMSRILNLFQDEIYAVRGNPLLRSPDLGDWGKPTDF